MSSSKWVLRNKYLPLRRVCGALNFFDVLALGPCLALSKRPGSPLSSCVKSNLFTSVRGSDAARTMAFNRCSSVRHAAARSMAFDDATVVVREHSLSSPRVGPASLVIAFDTTSVSGSATAPLPGHIPAIRKRTCPASTSPAWWIDALNALCLAWPLLTFANLSELDRAFVSIVSLALATASVATTSSYARIFLLVRRTVTSFACRYLVVW